MRQIIVLSSLLLLVNQSLSHKPTKAIRKRLNIGFCGKTEIRSKLNIDGYFTTTDTTSWISGYGSSQQKIDSSSWATIFFEDGTLVVLNAPYPELKYPENIERYLREVSNDSLNDFHTIKTFSDWGVYKISGDTIITQTITFRPYKAGVDRWEWHGGTYLILDRNHFAAIKHESIYMNTLIKHVANKHDHNILPARFTAFQPLPSSDCWLKKEEWMQCGNQNQ